MRIDQDLLRIFLENHFLKLKITLSELYNGQLLETLAGKMLRVFIYRTVRNLTCVCVCVVMCRRVFAAKEINRVKSKEVKMMRLNSRGARLWTWNPALGKQSWFLP